MEIVLLMLWQELYGRDAQPIPPGMAQYETDWTEWPALYGVPLGVLMAIMLFRYR